MRALHISALLMAPRRPAPGAGEPVPPASMPPRIVVDTTHHRPKPLNYFFRSALLPGWGQAALDRKLTAGIFIGFEGISLGMALKANYELHYLEKADTALVAARRQERQDWYVLVAVNHLFSALEAYVSANLFDFPGDLKDAGASRWPPGPRLDHVGIPHRMSNAPIGIFDSGIGGLTVARAIQDLLPHESTIYLGDTARVPYGPKSPATVRRYARGNPRVAALAGRQGRGHRLQHGIRPRA